MPTDIDSIVGNWYSDLDNGQNMMVVVVDEDRQFVEIQHFDGDLEEVDYITWYQVDLELPEPPENWSGQSMSQERK